MMDTDAIYSAIASRVVSSKRGYHEDAEFYQDEIKRLLNEADEEHKSVLAENERLVDEVNEARKETSEQARLNGMGAEREARLMAENAELRQENQRLAQAVRWESDLCHQALESRKELEAENAELKAKLTDKASLLRGCYAADHKQKQRIEELTSELERIKALPPVAWYAPALDGRSVSYFDGKPMIMVGPTGNAIHTTPLYALGSNDNVKLPLVATSDHPEFPVLAWSPLELAEINRLMSEAVRLNAQAVPDGWALVPVEATTDMLDAFRNHDASVLGPDFLGAYRAMLFAAPAAPQPAQQPLTDEKDALLRQALEACSAFRGAFDTPISRRRASDEFSGDARQRMRKLDEAIRNHLGVKND